MLMSQPRKKEKVRCSQNSTRFFYPKNKERKSKTYFKKCKICIYMYQKCASNCLNTTPIINCYKQSTNMLTQITHFFYSIKCVM